MERYNPSLRYGHRPLFPPAVLMQALAGVAGLAYLAMFTPNPMCDTVLCIGLFVTGFRRQILVNPLNGILKKFAVVNRITAIQLAVVSASSAWF